MKEKLFYNATFHSMKGEDDVFSFMTVSRGRITGTYVERPDGTYDEIDLNGQHVYPCLIDGHTHMLFTIGVMAMGFNICEVTGDGVKPDNISDIEKKFRAYCKGKPKNAIVAASNYVVSAVDVKRLPTKDELDSWCGGRPVIVYNIDGHSTSASSSMLVKLGINPEGHDGILCGEENERNQGKLTDIISSAIGLKALSAGIAKLHNSCAEYGINLIGALEGNGDSKNDSTTSLIVFLARRFDLQVRFYLQYADLERVKPYEKYLRRKRVGGCGDWEMDGSVGSHTAAFHHPYKDTETVSDCYYSQDQANRMVLQADSEGYQVASHAIGEKAIERIMEALRHTSGSTYHRIEHIEFINEESLSRLEGEKYAVFMQPGYSWVDKRYLHTYENYLPEKVEKKLKLKSIRDKGVLICGSSDSPVQAMDPYLQMLGMVEYYNPSESLTAYEALESYTVNPAKAMYENADYGSLEKGKIADFFTAGKDFAKLSGSEIASFRPNTTYYSGKPYRPKSEGLQTIIKILLKRPHKV